MIRFLRPFDPHRIRLLVFDLDGTLIDSRLDLIHSVNAMLQHIGRPALDGHVIASYVGDGAPALVRRAIGDTERRGAVSSGYGVFSWLLPHPQTRPHHGLCGNGGDAGGPG